MTKRMKTWQGWVVVDDDGYFATEVVFHREYLKGVVRGGQRIARVEVREVVGAKKPQRPVKKAKKGAKR